MAIKKTEKSPSGASIIRYEQRSKPFEAAYAPPDIDEIQSHIETHIGKIGSIFHELVSDLVHIDVFYIKPTPERNYITLVTGGMSYRPMNTPPGNEAYQYTELMLCLPPDWPLTMEDMKNERNYWPIRQLKTLARFPHEYDTWLGFGHTIPNGNRPRPFASNTKLCGMMLFPPTLFTKEFLALHSSTGKTILFFNLIPLCNAEMDFKLNKGLEPLIELFDKHKVSDIIDVNRPCVVEKKWRLF